MFIRTELIPEAELEWKSRVWSALYNGAQTLYNAAQADYYSRQQSIAAQIEELQARISSVDTLTLRREENEEIMKGVLRWLLGPEFEFMPPEVAALFTFSGDLSHGIAFTDNELTLSAPLLGTGKMPAECWTNMFRYQDMVKFINQAIEWENVLYFLYSYFWDVPPSWDFVRQLKHPDATRQAFLRAGSARVVLTVRTGWETAWVSFVETGGFGKTLLPSHPYMSIATEIQNYDRTNYPGIPPANPGGGPIPDSAAYVATQSTGNLPKSTAAVNIAVKSSDGFLVGYTAIIDTHASGVQETQTITAVPDSTHITVQALDNPHNGSTKPFAIMQAGEKGQLVAEWFE